MKIFIDFDDVIFNTQRFADDLRKKFELSGISAEMFDRSYSVNFKGKLRDIKKYNVWEHLKYFESKGYDVKKAEAGVAILMKKAYKYVFKDVPDFSNSLGKKNLCILSHGDIDFQKEKIISSKADRYFQKIIVLDKEVKSSSIKGLIPRKKIFFLDDKEVKIKEVKSKLPHVTTFLVKRKRRHHEDKKSRYCDFEVRSLKEAAKIITRINNS